MMLKIKMQWVQFLINKLGAVHKWTGFRHQRISNKMMSLIDRQMAYRALTGKQELPPGGFVFWE